MADAVDRCKRCGTKIRNQRTVCPSCGLDLAALAGAKVEVAEEAPAAPAIRKVAAKAGVKMCGVCMASVPEAELLDIDGQKMCANCAEKMKSKALRKGAEKK